MQRVRSDALGGIHQSTRVLKHMHCICLGTTEIAGGDSQPKRDRHTYEEHRNGLKEPALGKQMQIQHQYAAAKQCRLDGLKGMHAFSA